LPAETAETAASGGLTPEIAHGNVRGSPPSDLSMAAPSDFRDDLGMCRSFRAAEK
jgi:hypothetical protein